MNLQNPSALYLLLLIPVFLLCLALFKNKRKKQLLKFCDENLLSFHNTNFSNFYFNFKTVILILAFLFIVIALARPQWDREVRIIDTMGQDLVFCIDVSKSMDAQDILPTRLEAAKTHINLFLDELKGDRVAIVAFAGEAVVICPLTTDYAALKLIVSSLSTETITNYGTNIGAGLRKSAELFQQETNAKTIILMSDGEDFEQDAINQARHLASNGIVVYTLGFGTPGGSPIMIRNERGQNEYAKDDKGNVIITKVEVMMLHQIAEMTKGQFYMISPSYSEIYEVLKQIQNNEQTKFSTRQYFRYKEQYHYFVIIALILLLAESFIIFKIKEQI